MERRWARIINVLNVGGESAACDRGAEGGVARPGRGIDQSAGGRGAPHNVLVNALFVGKIVGDQIARRHANLETKQSLDAYIAAFGERAPIGRLGTAGEFANMACFLASDAGLYITGTAINVDGGLRPVIYAGWFTPGGLNDHRHFFWRIVT